MPNGAQMPDDESWHALLLRHSDFVIPSSLGIRASSFPGNTTRIVVPRPSSLSASTRPPCNCAMCLTIANPRPAPAATTLPDRFSRKKRSKIRGCAASEIPAPLSVTKQTQRFLREQKQEFENPDDLLVYINRARREVAGRTQCIRRLTPISGQVVSVLVTAGGSGYIAPVATITPPDFPSGVLPAPNGRQATTGVTKSAGVITGIDINDGGDGYFQPLITITDATGPGTVATAS